MANRTIVQRRVEYTKPKFDSLPITPEMMSFLAARGITSAVAARNQLASADHFMPQSGQRESTLAFPYVKLGEIVNIKFRGKEKSFCQVAGAEKTFYKYDDIAATTIVVEGEFDALALEVAGYQAAISVPDGAPSEKSDTYATKFDFLDDPRLEEVERWIIAVDNDGPGRKLEEELARRLGKDKCWRVSWPAGCKDANDVLLNHGAAVLARCIEDALPYPVDGAYSLEDFSVELDDIFERGMPQGTSTGWRCLDNLYRPVEGQWTLVTGTPGSGKSEWLDALAINLAEKENWVFGICSPENQPVSFHATKLLEKYVGKRIKEMSRDEFELGKEWVNCFVKFIMPEDRTLPSVLNVAKVLVRRYGMRGLVIDPYNEISHSGIGNLTETQYISEFLGELRAFAAREGIHVWLVAHPQKLRKEADGRYPVPTAYEVAGSAHFFNKADNIIVLNRNKDDRAAPTEIHVQKIRSRWLGQLGMTNLHYEPASGRYSEPAWTRSY